MMVFTRTNTHLFIFESLNVEMCPKMRVICEGGSAGSALSSRKPAEQSDSSMRQLSAVARSSNLS